MAVKVRVTKKRPGPVEQPVRTEFIKLQDFLKLCDAVPSGGMAKTFIQNGEVKVNGTVETRRGRKLYPGDEAEWMGNVFRVVSDAP